MLPTSAICQRTYGYNAESLRVDIATGEMYYSPRLYDLIALTPQELSTRQQWLDRIHPDDMPHYRAMIVAHLKGETERLGPRSRLDGIG
jgi:hypothetical protein